ncbi:MAG: mannose-1-phosphate guanylyltransferase [Muribaculaceae bacterium]|nr:mannose-1-phosphate guanylyltransferase [Muribaculaceae bacterium]MDE6754381.1 mannose-1-phosphate guanylyltransferase [Muribaculaceae bacterium]
MNRYCVIMCGGVGSRFWPFSRTDRPKQFLDFFGTGRSLLQLTVERISSIVPPENIVLVTNRLYEPLIREQLPEIRQENILLEPARRNTAPCICWAANHIAALNPDAAIVTLPSDHLVLKEREFEAAILEGFDFVEKDDRLLTLGINPTNPNTGYGYIQQGTKVKGWQGIRKVKSFTEKPNREMAELFLKSGEFFWNSGMFLWSAKSILKAFDKYAPNIGNLFHAPDGIYGSAEEAAFIEKNFPNAQGISIDYAIMEKADNVYVKTVDLGWSDLGTWHALYEASPHNSDGNVTQNCKVLPTDCQGSIFATSSDKVIVVKGLKDYIVADSENALLIYPLEEEQKIRQIVNEIKSRFGDNFV